ncbi:cytochrome P450 [Deinococcus sp. Marseille-Q6407]|uniref:cytochrome P450 n=1 Tax=Deinococcus sp. Marseille-Q6407 TaxID=2969223 RepID=UPI0021BE483A|nr:cytochrome P450 [Deinococcus sp. Marseille-Q6407]
MTLSRPPHAPEFDSTLALLSEGYPFFLRRARQLHTPVFGFRLAGVPFKALSGEAAARLFYDEALFQREGGTPPPLKHTLLGVGGVQGLDDAEHRWRKDMFMSLMTPAALAEMQAITLRQWHAYAAKWETAGEIVLLDEVSELLARAACEWAGVPLPEAEVPLRTRQLRDLIESPAALDFKQVQGRLSRRAAEAWAGRMVAGVRSGTLDAPEGRALKVIALHRDLSGELLTPKVAAVEVLNIIRPIVAVARYVVFEALALHEYPAEQARVRQGGAAEARQFAQEVRRFYPFFPAAPALVRETFRWQGVTFRPGDRVMLDLFGTSREQAVWGDPDTFRPARFATWDGSPFNFVPQGGGDHWLGHRCAGEWLTIDLMVQAAQFLTRELTYRVPPQNLAVKYSRMPAQPQSGFVTADVRRKEA